VLELLAEFVNDFPELTKSQIIRAVLGAVDKIQLEGDTLKIPLTNFKMEEAAMQKIHNDLLGYLKEHSQNKNLLLEYVRVDSDTLQEDNHRDVASMTDQEQLEYLANQNPVIKDLIEMLNLDLKY
jgi:hypothetical protein